MNYEEVVFFGSISINSPRNFDPFHNVGKLLSKEQVTTFSLALLITYKMSQGQRLSIIAGQNADTEKLSSI